MDELHSRSRHLTAENAKISVYSDLICKPELWIPRMGRERRPRMHPSMQSSRARVPFAGNGQLSRMVMAVKKKSGTEGENKSKSRSIDELVGNLNDPIVSFPEWTGEVDKQGS